MTDRYALISVSDKTDIEKVAEALIQSGLTLLSTGGTLKALEEANIPVLAVETVTEFPEMMDGRVKTLHPKIHGGLLGVRKNEEHKKAMSDHGIVPIDVVVVNLYPFKETIQHPNTSLLDAIENIDIGGPSMLRSAAKNYQSVTVVTDPRDYPLLIEQLTNNNETTLQFRQYLAKKVFQLTAYYDSLIAEYLTQQFDNIEAEKSNDWPHITLTYEHSQSLRYGENSHQAADFYTKLDAPEYSLANAVQLHGKELSYNNIKDANAALQIIGEFPEPCAVAVKHLNPCGVAIGSTIEQAFNHCFEADPISIFGGIVVLNRPVTLALAEKLHDIFLEIVIAPSFEEDAFQLLAKKKNIRLMTVHFSEKDNRPEMEYASVSGGLLVQNVDCSSELTNPSEWETMTELVPTEKEKQALSFGMRVCKHVKSNAIVISNEYRTLGIGSGQMNRVGAAKIALEQAKNATKDMKDSLLIMASDAFFPMDDTVKLAHEYGVSSIIQPAGSLKDKDSIAACNELGMSMVKTGIRHFKH
ncbi:bifunctional phosphoribosylaminoimidazolecarboxamide formyltransferase/IMP cyclohydrolase [Jeotgalibaca ciconiae]|uniref:Bifunctional purine biosynthesis protein PurH n=1 Tax=Jeotgalibaca ciconiae TaxID=2496265 RepID=A0A3Q9BNL1_9LACT|nr:bifunctional phosphoribosylaminoimidazolecarboxamide formyltransferase/IMP cyclohydrolase [Jeotgalibaca ciconiae]AZP05356.1 bifunctional phosphoribosylaminoimidazolecarboxamide formyltransferase/IMP cyclohydrolase PurH [Jeotgalibaca ciconiae]HJB22591.1 bifunctional phosphoribosylaminoimidazolecarboxamide formyltransferase/IMP cyclohydrolase [Candidatus Jeotgalibaca pullicola]